jgi:hypothetical protein
MARAEECTRLEALAATGSSSAADKRRALG